MASLKPGRGSRVERWVTLSHPLLIASLLLAVPAAGRASAPTVASRPGPPTAGDFHDRILVRGAWGRPITVATGASVPAEPAGCAKPGAPGIWCAPKRLFR
jgi:hypothetical protein